MLKPFDPGYAYSILFRTVTHRALSKCMTKPYDQRARLIKHAFTNQFGSSIESSAYPPRLRPSLPPSPFRSLPLLPPPSVSPSLSVSLSLSPLLSPSTLCEVQACIPVYVVALYACESTCCRYEKGLKFLCTCTCLSIGMSLRLCECR